MQQKINITFFILIQEINNFEKILTRNLLLKIYEVII
jgi:hypothetical protein